MDKDATIVFLDRFAVRVAGVIDPTRFVPADLGIDDVGAIVNSKKKCVRIVHIGQNTYPSDRATLLQVRAESGSAERNRSLMFYAMKSARNRLQNAVRLRLGCVPGRTA